MKKLQIILVGTLFFMGMLITSCEKWNPWEDGGGNGGGNGGGGTNCLYSGTLVRVPCGVSDIDNLWIRTDNGDYYQPCDASILHTMDLAYPLQEGQRINFGYKPLKGESVCDQEQVMFCAERWPDRTKIKLTCIQPVFRCGTDGSLTGK